ncbi:MAG: aminotransferase class IV, partial [bacterium]
MSRSIAWLNGEFMDLEAARVSVEDRGFQFADGIYEVIRVYSQTLFAVERHFERMRRSLGAIDLELAMSDADIRSVFDELITRSELAEAQIYLQVTRGVMPREHKIRPGLNPTVLATIQPPRVVPDEVRKSGASVITLPDERWERCDIKSIGLLLNVLAKNKAARKGAYDAIFVRNGVVTEATTSNVF